MTTSPTVDQPARPRILLVDDERSILTALRRQLDDEYEVVTALDGPTALGLLERQGPFAVVLSDMRMPIMDGAEFLARARALARESTRILLTGQADIDTAIAAVNQGQIFKFLSKPCPITVLRDCLREAVTEHLLGLARREIIDQSLLVPPQSIPDGGAASAELATALAAGQFAMWYQPVVDLRSGRVAGAEALIRWQHPERGLVPPDEFVPVAEASGLIVQIGRWALGVACQDAAGWPVLDPAGPLSVAVNLSARQLRDPRLLDDVRSAITRSGLDARRLVLEITETTLMHDTDHTVRTIDALRGMGIGISIDDFGTGYSSLSYLQTLPVDTLKVDRAFVTKMGDSTSAAVTEAIVRLAHTLNLNIVAEGIETDAQLRHCRELGCQHGQGYRFSKPVDASAFLIYLDTQQQLPAPRP